MLDVSDTLDFIINDSFKTFYFSIFGSLYSELINDVKRIVETTRKT
jgi:hypothetical protein